MGMGIRMDRVALHKLTQWLLDVLTVGSGRNDAILLAHAYRTDNAAEIAELATALNPSAERLLETQSQGVAFGKTTRAIWPDDLPDLDLIFIESGGDNLSATFSPELADLTIYVIDVAAGEEIPRKGGPAITRSDLLVINKTALAPYVGASLDVMARDSQRMR